MLALMLFTIAIQQRRKSGKTLPWSFLILIISCKVRDADG